MKIDIGGKMIELPDAEVNSCRKVVAKVLGTIMDESAKKGYYTYYFTFIFTMYMITEQIISDMDPMLISQIMQSLGGRKRGPLSFPDAMKAFDKALKDLPDDMPGSE